MALYHMLNVSGGNISWSGLVRTLRREGVRQAAAISKQWAPHRRQAVLLSSSLIVIENNDQKRRKRLLRTPSNHAELSPSDASDDTFYLTSHAHKHRMRLFAELRDSLPSSSETLDKIDAAKKRLTSSLHQISERLNNEQISDIISEHATKIADNIDPEQMAEQVAGSITETFEETREVLQNITQRFVRSPGEPGVAQPIPPDTSSHHHVDIGLTQDIISQNKRREDDEDTELMPRIKAAVRQFKTELEADVSGDPPISLMSRKAKERIETFINSKRQQVSQKISEKLEIVKEISVIGGKKGGDKSVMEYITSNIPHHDLADDLELQDIMMESAGIYYNDTFCVDDVTIENEQVLVGEGWSKEMSNDKIRIWKRCNEEEDVTLYKIFGRFDTISAVEFYNAQVNDQYRSDWDRSVSSLYVVDNITNNREIVYWATKFPFPLQDRDYVFERSHCMNDKQLEISSRSVTHKSKPVSSKFVRVYKYGSKLVIRPDKDLYQKGMNYCLTYYDDFGMPIPGQVRDRLVSTRVPDFLDKVHDAAVHLGGTGKLYVPYPEPNRHSS